ncbi:class Ib ribonucleoside-diphosphate reductase assembly flavoprotein NrdI [Rhizobium sp. RM]|uniref:class Ib ribonucleoside-diphosphate reductase assembly flavoprotein NrdI n=1 Tax=Rhizobium/Agrobacterium group TaxID=227290 RepID=UPI00110EB2FC|nr:MULTISPECIES: class Ib ribonucleoside-diphosphate reductase assembly flavoprotein NrdI [Rhizobium/Agrobacterium group]NWJ24398.1 class Ib ribonucleoside-diphosphate reductase assembly flavoprotein NrdI [Rhizobium sp. RM]TMV16221.1 class Ib ribonucleoside-diphosphate reductase assembly flavoprotein NrdI [Rhizobium sp. Td3]UXS02744.1 class Ib ribonucleoside-diphosphate reductase assembly flavoprotein NrdI [Agrobacterium tumefaciens]
MGLIVYYSSRSENTHRFVQKLGGQALRLPIGTADETLLVSEPYVLVTPTYGGGGTKGAVPKPVIRFLNEPANRNLIRGVIAAGNTNFGAAFASAGEIVSRKCAVPFLYRFELLGTEEDVANVTHGLERFWTR